MVLQVAAERDDTLEGCLLIATKLAATLQIAVMFYYDRQPYSVKPGDTPETVLAAKENK
jgi:hypothetical protein